MCDIPVVFDLVFKLVFFNKVVEFPTKSPGLIDVVNRLFVREYVVDAARLALLLVTALEAFVFGLLVVSRRPRLVDPGRSSYSLAYL